MRKDAPTTYCKLFQALVYIKPPAYIRYTQDMIKTMMSAIITSKY